MTLRSPAQGGADLDARYGRRPRRRGVVGVVIAAAVLAAAAIGWFFWANPLSVQEFWTSIGYQVVDDGTVKVTWAVDLDDGQLAHCAIAAENSAQAIVGWKVVDVTGTAAPTVQRTDTIRTTEQADTGLAYRCWLA